jgi:hypothetical protein
MQTQQQKRRQERPERREKEGGTFRVAEVVAGAGLLG